MIFCTLPLLQLQAGDLQHHPSTAVNIIFFTVKLCTLLNRFVSALTYFIISSDFFCQDRSNRKTAKDWVHTYPQFSQFLELLHLLLCEQDLPEKSFETALCQLLCREESHCSGIRSRCAWLWQNLIWHIRYMAYPQVSIAADMISTGTSNTGITTTTVLMDMRRITNDTTL